MQKTIYFNEAQVLPYPIEDVWTRLSDTNALNKFIGLAPVEFTAFQLDENKLMRHAQATTARIVKTEWTENVFEWVREQHYIIERQYTKGPIDHVLWKVAVEAMTENETRVHLTGEFTVKGIFGQLALKTIIFPQLRKTFDYVQMNQGKTLTPTGKGNTIQVDDARLRLLTEKLRAQFPEEVMIGALIQTLNTETDEKVSGMQPYFWAAQHAFDRHLSVELFLTATQVGLLDQEWSMMCPNCRVPKGRTNTLKQLEKTVHCDLCGIDFDVDFERYIEIRFSVNASIREANQVLYCINGPTNSPHILAQFRFGTHTTKEVSLPKWQQRLRWRVLRDNVMIDVNPNEQHDQLTLTYTAQGLLNGSSMNSNSRPVGSTDDTWQVADEQSSIPTAQSITLHNETDTEIVLVLEEVDWDEFALTARDATTYQVFRDLFATDVLSTDQQISVGQLTILFTDLKGSTQLYEAIGDAPAYSNVKKHFDYLMHHIRINEGAIVKTIGDAVMAVFNTEDNALKASLAIQQNIETLNELLTQPVDIRIGFHTGPVIAVNANEVLDYFGHTVNLAARIQNESQGGDIVLSEKIYNDLINTSTLNSEIKNVSIESFLKQLVGLSEHTKLIRLRIIKK